MKKKHLSLIICFVLCTAVQIQSQNIELRLPAYASDTVFISAFCGAKKDTVVYATLDKDGKAKLKQPQGRGICFLQIKQDVNLAFICSDKEKPEVSGDKPKFENSTENDSINAWFARQNTIRERTGFWQYGLQVYKENDSPYQMIKQGIEALNAEKAALTQTISGSSLYAARYLQMRNFLDERSGALHEYEQDTAACRPFRNYLLDSLDIETLYRSDMWFSVFNTAIELYRELGNFQKRGVFWGHFGEDMQHIYARIRDEEIRTAFAADIKGICQKMDWDYPL
jgi:hypothetical protein